jgi:hypothetical protein
MLCARCQEKEASVHLTTILHGRGEETIHVCKDCGAEMTPIPAVPPSTLEVLPVIARKCEICGKEAFSAKRFAGGGAIYWCFDCAAEHKRTLAALFMSEHADFLQCLRTRTPPEPFISDPGQFQVWLDEAAQRVVQMLKARQQGAQGSQEM